MTTVKQPLGVKQGDFAQAVKIKLIRKGWTVTRLAGELGYARGTVSTAIHHPSMLADVRDQIRKLLKL